MAKLTKQQIKLHHQATELLEQDILSIDEKFFVLDNWKENATHINSSAGAFFTPWGLARDFAVVCGEVDSVIDLCAGIGKLSFAIKQMSEWSRRIPKITCVEINPDYVAVGKKILPEANWICSSVFDPQLLTLDRAHMAISNPPFGRIKRGGDSPNYKGAEFELHVINIASKVAEFGQFIIPPTTAGFKYSGVFNFKRDAASKGHEFQQKLGLTFNPQAIDATVYSSDWNGVSPACEVVSVDFTLLEEIQIMEAAQ